METCLIFNPAARGHRAAYIRDHIADIADDCLIQPTRGPGDARVLARNAIDKGCTTVVAAGGDGTVNEVLNGITDHPRGLETTRLGVLPAGTANVFALELGMPRKLAAAWQVIRQGREKKIDLPHADYTKDGQPVRRYFIQLAGAGLDTRAITLVDPAHKRNWGSGSYIFSGFEALTEDLPPIDISGPDFDPPQQGGLVIIGNGRFYGGAFNFLPRASLTDGLIDVLIYPKADLLSLCKVCGGWLAGRLDKVAGARYFQTRTFTLSSPCPTEFQLDGENVAPLPATFGIRPNALRVITA